MTPQPLLVAGWDVETTVEQSSLDIQFDNRGYKNKSTAVRTTRLLSSSLCFLLMLGSSNIYQQDAAYVCCGW